MRVYICNTTKMLCVGMCVYVCVSVYTRWSAKASHWTRYEIHEACLLTNTRSGMRTHTHTHTRTRTRAHTHIHAHTHISTHTHGPHATFRSTLARLASSFSFCFRWYASSSISSSSISCSSWSAAIPNATLHQKRLSSISLSLSLSPWSEASQTWYYVKKSVFPLLLLLICHSNAKIAGQVKNMKET